GGRAQGRYQPLMMLGYPKSLQSKLLAVVLLTTLVALGIALGAMVAYGLRTYHKTWLADVETQAQLLGQATAPALTFDDVKVAREVGEQRDYSRRARRLSDDEVGTLVDSFNAMMAEIEKRSVENEASIRNLALEMNQRHVAQQEVMRLNRELEQRVRERTAQ